MKVVENKRHGWLMTGERGSQLQQEYVTGHFPVRQRCGRAVDGHSGPAERRHHVRPEDLGLVVVPVDRDPRDWPGFVARGPRSDRDRLAGSWRPGDRRERSFSTLRD